MVLPRVLAAFAPISPLNLIRLSGTPRICGGNAQWRTAPTMAGRPAQSKRGGSASTRGAKKEEKKRRPRVRKAIKGELSNVGISRPIINWYPGHIAKAERALIDALRVVDVVIEVRDSRAPIATAHPSVPEWVGARNHVVVLTRADLCADSARREWAAYMRETGVPARFVDAKHGRGVLEVRRIAAAAGEKLKERRERKGLRPRDVRCAVVGYPNVGKSALINRLAARKATRSANTPGITRNFQWVRLCAGLELLDMPGVIPMRLDDQTVAGRLAICDDIGHGAYDVQLCGALLIEELKRASDELPKGYFDITALQRRYKVDPTGLAGEEFLYQAADLLHNGDVQRMANRLLFEFRNGYLGPVGLESPSMLVRD